MVVVAPAVVSAFGIKPPSRSKSSSSRVLVSIGGQQRRSKLTALFASKSDDAIDVELAPHFTSQPVLEWLQKMADSYKLERGNDLLFDVILAESANGGVDADVGLGNDNSELPYLLRLATACAKTNLAIASHDFLRDPSGVAIFNYGNLAFLDGFGYPWEEFVRLPSSSSVDTAGDVEERQKLLDSVKTRSATIKSGPSDDNENNEVDEGDNDLAVIRVRKDGRKILLKGVNLWNVYDVCLEEDVESGSVEFLRAEVESGKIKAIGQAVWVEHVDYLD